MSARLVTRCGLCASENLEPVLNLGSSPATCSMAKVGTRQAAVEFHPLEVLVCQDCTLAQLSVIVDPEETFPQDYPYSSGNSQALHDDFEELATQVDVGPGDLVVDIGANDGTLLSKFDCRTVGVEPTLQRRKIIRKMGSAYPDAYREFFTEDLAKRIVQKHGHANVVTACNVLAHVEDIHDVMRGIDILLAEDGVVVAENHDLQSVVDGQWDTVYHEHLRFFDAYSFDKLLDQYEFRAKRWQDIPTHGGSFRALAGRGKNGAAPFRPSYDFDKLAQTAREQRERIRREATGIFGIGATARATTIINYCGLDVEDIVCVCEVEGSDKIGRYIPGTRIPVVDEKALTDEHPNDQPPAMLFSWHLADRIVPSLRERGYEGEIILPLPVPA